jgi:putative hydroxymethylpyrimidine transport system substrate-binding protein
MRAIRKTMAMAAVLAVSAGLGGCGEGSETEKAQPLPPVPKEMDITLDGYPSAQNVGVLMAEKRGYFDDAGLEIWVRTPQSRVRPLPYVVGGEVDLAISHQPQVVLAGEKGVPVVAFGSLISEPTAAMIWLEKSKIGGIGDMRGKTIAITGLSFEKDLLESVLAQANLTLDDVKVERADYELVPALVSGRADAILGSGNLEGAELESRGLKPVVTPVTSLGVPSYDELVLIARPELVAEDPRSIRSFMAAVAKGTAAAIEDPRAAATAVEQSVGSNPDLGRKEIEAGVEATLPLLSEDGYMDPDQGEGLIDWMQTEGMIQDEVPESELFSNDFLPQG